MYESKVVLNNAQRVSFHQEDFFRPRYKHFTRGGGSFRPMGGIFTCKVQLCTEGIIKDTGGAIFAHRLIITPGGSFLPIGGIFTCGSKFCKEGTI